MSGRRVTTPIISIAVGTGGRVSRFRKDNTAEYGLGENEKAISMCQRHVHFVGLRAA